MVTRIGRVRGRLAAVLVVLAAAVVAYPAAHAQTPPNLLAGVQAATYGQVASVGGGCFLAAAAPGADPWASGVVFNHFPLEAGADYIASFTASADPGDSQVRFNIGVDQDPWPSTFDSTIAVPAAPTPFTFTFSGGLDSSLGQVAFQVGGSNQDFTFCLEDLTLVVDGELPPDPVAQRVRANQVGYLTHGPKRATLVFEQGSGPGDGVSWQLIDGDGVVAVTGVSQPRGFDPTAGFDTHVIDFSAFTEEGEGYTLVADGDTSHPFEISASVYDGLRLDSLNAYYSQRSGIEILDSIKPGYGRPAGHVSSYDGSDVNKGDLDVPCLPNDPSGFMHYGAAGWHCPPGYALDVTGGWYDAGDHGKYVVNSGISVWQLLNLYERSQSAGVADREALADGALSIPETDNGVPDVLDEARWNLEWMLKMQVPAGTEMGIGGQTIDAGGLVHHKLHDIAWTGIPTYPHQDGMRRYVHRPSTAATLNLAAAAAQGARIYDAFDPVFADELLDAALAAWEAANDHPAIYAPDTNALDPNPGGGPYNDNNVTDEFYWAAVQLWLTTRDDAFLPAIVGSPSHTGGWPGGGAFGWQQVGPAGRIDLALFGDDLPGHDQVVSRIVVGAEQYLGVQANQPFGHPYGPNYSWGSSHQVLNNALVIATAYDLTGDERYLHGAIEAVDYVLGRNAIDNSYVAGYGTNYSNNMHSRWYAHSLNPQMPPPPPGKLAGGANQGLQDPVAQANLQGCAPQACYIDHIGSWSTNETTINWNAALAWMASWLADMGDGDPDWAPVGTDPGGQDPSIDLTLSTSPRCVAGNVFLVVTARNDNEVPVDIEVESAFGSRAFAGVAVDRFASHAFTTRSPSVAGGSVTVRASAVLDGVEVSDEWTVDVDGASC